MGEHCHEVGGNMSWRLKACGIGVGLVLTWASPAFADRLQFDLVCTGKITLGDRKGQVETFRLSVDLARKLYAYKGKPSHPIRSVMSDKIVFQDRETDTDQNHFWVMRGDGHFVRADGSRLVNFAEFVSGSCESAPFSEFVSNRF